MKIKAMLVRINSISCTQYKQWVNKKLDKYIEMILKRGYKHFWN